MGEVETGVDVYRYSTEEPVVNKKPPVVPEYALNLSGTNQEMIQ